MVKKILGLLTVFVILGISGYAFAQEVPLPDTDLGGFFQFVYQKLQTSEWMVVFGAFLVGAVFVVRKILASQVAWFKTKLGGYVVSFGTALGLAMGTALMAGQMLNLGLAMTALSAAFMAAGKWEALRDILSYIVGSKEETEE